MPEVFKYLIYYRKKYTNEKSLKKIVLASSVFEIKFNRYNYIPMNTTLIKAIRIREK